MIREISDLLVVGAGPTGIAIGAHAPKIVGHLLARLRSPVAV